MSSTVSLQGLIVTAALSSSGCSSHWTAEESQCEKPFIYSLTASPEEVYGTDAVVMSASVYNRCLSLPVLTFPEYDASVTAALPGYQREPSGLAGVEGVVLEPTDEPFVYATQALPLDSFTPGYLRYSLTVYGGVALFDKIDAVNSYLTILSGGE